MKDSREEHRRLALTLAEHGFSYELISRKTGLRKGQVGYLLRKEKVELSDYRLGKNDTGKRVIQSLTLPRFKRKVA